VREAHADARNTFGYGNEKLMHLGGLRDLLPALDGIMFCLPKAEANAESSAAHDCAKKVGNRGTATSIPKLPLKCPDIW
jgi:hypothetical protein